MMYIKYDPDTLRLTAVAAPGYHCGEGEVSVELPEDFASESIADWKYDDGKLVYDPLPVEPVEEPVSDSERIAALEKKVGEQAALLAAYEAAYKEGVQSA